METRLAMDSKTKHLCVNIKKTFEHDSDTQLKVHGVLDTQTATGQFHATLHKFFRLGKLPLPSPTDMFQTDTRLRLGVGAKARSSNVDDMLLTVSAKKKVDIRKQKEVVRNRVNLLSFTQLTVAANYDYNMRAEKWSGEARAQLSHAWFGFTEGQDLKVSAGYRATFTPQAITSKEPYMRVQENCWGLQTTFKGAGRADWLLTYDL